ncbi:MAG: flavin reductase family protein [Acidimicrobiales bacterium]
MGFATLTAAIDYPMVIVTVAALGQRSGCLVGFHTQCSIRPRRYAVFLSRQNHTYAVAQGADVMAVHFPTTGQRALAELFGAETGDRVDKFSGCRWEPGPGGTPLLSDCPSRLIGRVADRIDVGDHVAYVLDVFEATVAGPSPTFLTFQQIRDLEPGHPA